MPSVEEHPAPAEVRRFALTQICLTGMFLALLFFLAGGTDADYPPIWLVVLLAALVGAGAVLADRVWLTASPLPADADAVAQHEQALSVFAAQTVRKLVYCEAPLLVAVVVAFTTDHGGWPVVVAGFPGLLVLTWEVWPSPRNTSLSAAMLDSQGADSHLVESFLDA
jgi:hypothetical protein